MNIYYLFIKIRARNCANKTLGKGEATKCNSDTGEVLQCGELNIVVLIE